MDRLESLAAFVAVAEQGGFAAAARKLRVSPPAVTRAIAGLEQRLGVALLKRTTRSVRITDDGALFLARCRQVLADLRDAEHAVMGGRSEPRGMLVVTAPVVFGRMFVVPIVSAWLRQHAQASARLLLADRNIQLVEEGIDVAVRIGELADSALRATRVGEVRRVVVASPAYLGSRGAPASADELRNHTIVSFTGISGSDDWRFGDGRTSVHVRPRLILNTADAAIAAAKEGLGITRVLSYQVRNELAAGLLRTILEADTPRPLPVNLLFQANRAASPILRSFIDRAKDYFRSVTP